MERVRLINDPTQIGFLTGIEQYQGDRRYLQVQFPESIKWKPENQLEIVENFQLSPLDMLESKKLGRPIDFRRALTHIKLSGALADVLYSMEATNTDFYPYQFKPVLKMLESPTNGILIADEVGLGKTIEAGLIWVELKSRYDLRKLLILCPAALREKWQYELQSKMGVQAEICNAQQALDILSNLDKQARGFAIICSIQGLRPPSGWSRDDNIKTASKKLAQYLQLKENDERLIDLLVIDEAHHLRNQETQTHEIGQLCRNVSEHTVLLTATPIHTTNQDLLSLLKLLDPDTFSDSFSFSRILKANSPLIQARDLVLGPNCEVESLTKIIAQAKNDPLLENSKQLSLIIESGLTDKNLRSREFRSQLAHRLETVNLLGHVITRTRKREVTEWRVIRIPILESVSLTDSERMFYNLVTDLVAKYAEQLDINELFLLAQPQRQMTSSMAASLIAWQEKLIEIEEVEELNETGDKKRSLGPLITEIVFNSLDFVELKDLINFDSKFDRLNEIVQKYLQDHPAEKIIIFSAFRSTIKYLSNRLYDNGITNIILMGGQVETKDEIIQQFRNSKGPSVLLSSEVGGEGVDLQFSRVIINYDLPWNPMRIEQRIGRIDRLGQKADAVLIWNIVLDNTIDSRIYRRLYERLNLCQYALGDFESILGEKIGRLEMELLSGKLTPEQQEHRIEQTAQALETIKLQGEKLEEEASHLVAYGDYILNQVRAAKELHRWISPEDIYMYVSNFISIYYPGSMIQRDLEDKTLFKIELSNQAKSDLAEYIRLNKIQPVSSLSTAAGSTNCRFDSMVFGVQNRRVETISQLHPLVKMIKYKLNVGDNQVTPAIATIIRLENLELDLSPGEYVLAVVHWKFKGLQSTEKLIYAARSLHKSDEIIDSIDAEKLANAIVLNGADWLEAQNTLDMNDVIKLAKIILWDVIDVDYTHFVEELTAKNEDRANIQLHNLTQHEVSQEKKLSEIEMNHYNAGRASLGKATRGRIEALKKRVILKRTKIENERKTEHSSNELAIALISIQN